MYSRRLNEELILVGNNVVGSDIHHPVWAERFGVEGIHINGYDVSAYPKNI